MAVNFEFEGCYAVTCGDRFEAMVSLGKGAVTSEAVDVNINESYDPNSVKLADAEQILTDRMFTLTSEFRGEPIVIWPLKDWEEYAKDDYILPSVA